MIPGATQVPNETVASTPPYHLEFRPHVISSQQGNLNQPRPGLLRRIDHLLIKITRIIHPNGRTPHALAHRYPIDPWTVDVDQPHRLRPGCSKPHVSEFNLENLIRVIRENDRGDLEALARLRPIGTGSCTWRFRHPPCKRPGDRDRSVRLPSPPAFGIRSSRPYSAAHREAAHRRCQTFRARWVSDSSTRTAFSGSAADNAWAMGFGSSLPPGWKRLPRVNACGPGLVNYPRSSRPRGRLPSCRRSPLP